MSLFSRGGIFKLYFSKFKQFVIINFSIIKKRTWASDLLSRCATIYAFLGIIVLDTKSQNIPEVVYVRRWAVGVLGIWREEVGI